VVPPVPLPLVPLALVPVAVVPTGLWQATRSGAVSKGRDNARIP
jgi:hypothetical protein